MSPVVAAGNGLYLVVWVERLVNAYPAEADIYGMRVRASDGALLDSAPILIATGPGDQIYPAVAFDGTNFLVVWQRIEGVPPQVADVYGARVRAADGVVLDTPRKLSDPNPTLPNYGFLGSGAPQVAFDGTHYLVVWHGYFLSDGVLHSGNLGAWVRPSDGQRIDPTAFVISSPGRFSRMAYGGGRYLLVGDYDLTENPQIYGVRIDAASRQVLDAAPLPIATTEEWEEFPSVASDGNDFLVTWWISTSHTLQMARVRGSDGALIEPASTLPDVSLTPASVTYDGRDYRMAWMGFIEGALRVVSTRVPATGDGWEHLFLSELEFISDWDWLGIAAAGKGRFLETYARFDPYVNHAKMRLVEDVQPEEPCDTRAPTLVLNGAAEPSLECTAGSTYSDPGAQAFDGCGNPLQVHTYNSGNDASGPGPNLGVEGSYSISYVAWDAAGRTVSAIRTVNVDDRAAPALKLLGPAFMTHTCNSPWVDPGVEATDACYGSLTHTVWHTGEVNGWAEGAYTVTYSLMDSGGNSAAPVTRTVEVVDCPW